MKATSLFLNIVLLAVLVKSSVKIYSPSDLLEYFKSN